MPEKPTNERGPDSRVFYIYTNRPGTPPRRHDDLVLWQSVGHAHIAYYGVDTLEKAVAASIATAEAEGYKIQAIHEGLFECKTETRMVRTR